MFYFCGFVDGVDGLQPLLLDVLLCTNVPTATTTASIQPTINYLVVWFSFFVVLLLLFIPFQLLPFLFGYFRFYTIDKFLAKFQDVILIQTVLVVLFCFIIIIITSQCIVSYRIASVQYQPSHRLSTRVSIPSGGTTTECTKYKLQMQLDVCIQQPTNHQLINLRHRFIHIRIVQQRARASELASKASKHITSKYRNPLKAIIHYYEI